MTPSVADVDAIAGIADPVVRNLRITQCYHDLSHGTALLMGARANWCTFATWASRQAGQTIRGEDLRRTAESLLGSPDAVRLIEAIATHLHGVGVTRDLESLRRTVRDVLDPVAALRRAADAVGRGNLKVFAEIGREFARYVAEFRDDDQVDKARTRAFCADLRTGEPPDGQDLLRDAFLAYCEARFEPSERAKAELLFYANLLVGLHEQTRLQPEILEAMNASIGDAEALKRRLSKALLPGWWLGLRQRVSRLFRREPPLDRLVDRLIAVVQTGVRRAISDMLMTLHLPGGKPLRLGRDLTTGFPASLAHPVNERLLTLLARIDPTPDSPAGSGARDWAHLPDRMHFIADLFRSHHEAASLFEPPFSTAQVAALMDGLRPEGRL